MKKMLKIVASAVLTLTLFAGLCVTSLAANEITGTENEPAQVVLTKQLNIADGVTTPEADFKFTFTQNTEIAGCEEDTVAIEEKTISYESTDAAIDNKIVKTTENVLDSVTWPHAGVYAFHVKETANTYEPDDNETMTYSGAEYIMYVYIKNNEAGTDVYPASVTVEKIKNDVGEELTTSEKVDPTPGSGEEGGSSNGFRFVNVYNKIAGPVVPPVDPENPPAENTYNSLVIDKTVAGEFGNKTNQYFNFTVTMTKAATLVEEENYSWYVEDVDGNIVTAGTIETGSPLAFQLKHNEKIVFENVLAGTKYTVTETGTEKYISSATYVENGTSKEDVGVVDEAADLQLTNKLIGENSNSVSYVNTHTGGIIETGIIINNFPFIIMLAVAVFGIFMLVLSKKYREE